VLRRDLPGEGPRDEEPLDPEGPLSQRLEQLRSRGQGHGRLTLASVVRAREVLGGALAGNRPLGREDRTVLGTASVAVLLLALLAALLPSLVGWVVAAAAGWIGLTTGARAFLQARRARAEERSHVAEDAGLEAGEHADE
jgi:hypothetical protein